MRVPEESGGTMPLLTYASFLCLCCCPCTVQAICAAQHYIDEDKCLPLFHTALEAKGFRSCADEWHPIKPNLLHLQLQGIYF